jgi:hypothetical protein
MADARTLAAVALVASVPLVIVFSLALLRGYDVTIHFRKRDKRHDE